MPIITCLLFLFLFLFIIFIRFIHLKMLHSRLFFLGLAPLLFLFSLRTPRFLIFSITLSAVTSPLCTAAIIPSLSYLAWLDFCARPWDGRFFVVFGALADGSAGILARCMEDSASANSTGNVSKTFAVICIWLHDAVVRVASRYTRRRRFESGKDHFC